MLDPSQSQTLKQDCIRLDILLTQANMVRSRTEAQELIAAGLVLVDGKQVLKPGQSFAKTSRLEISSRQRRFVSRGGEKLEAALIAFHICVKGKNCLDVGASTGGFTDCLLQYEASHITAIDVGHGQLDSTLAGNPKVDSREGIHVKNLTQKDLPEMFDLVVVDLSFISLRLALPILSQFVAREGDVLCLVKPQFEVGRQGLGRGGIVRSAALRDEAVAAVLESAKSLGYIVCGSMESPLRGGDGNMEFLIHLKQEEPSCKTKSC